jgi:hypothetical protein
MLRFINTPLTITNMYEAKVANHIEDICSASKFLDQDKYRPGILQGKSPRYSYDVMEEPDIITSRFGDYSTYSRKRLEIVKSKFEELGYNANLKDFQHDGFNGTNGIFRLGQQSEKEIWITAHHDYCAGLGAEDNATALAVMIELAKYFRFSPIGQDLVFASFDLEELDAIGSNYYCNQLNKGSIEKIKYVINIDCLSGKEVVIFEKLDGARSDKNLVKQIHETATNLDYKFIVGSNVTLVTDQIPFARKRKSKIRTVGIHSLDYSFYQNFWVADVGNSEDIYHTNNDLPENVNMGNLVKVLNTLIEFIKNENNVAA